LIQADFQKWDKDAIETSRKQLKFGFSTALLGPVAVLLLTVQVLVVPYTSPFSITLIGLELVALLFALGMGFLPITPRGDEWVYLRLRAEVFRREGFLLQARVGPYLITRNLLNTVEGRRLVINNTNRSPSELIALQDPGGRPWRDELEDAGRTRTDPPQPDVLRCLNEFLQHRVLDQQTWFSAKCVFHMRRDSLYGSVAKAALLIALVVAAMHFIALATGGHGAADQRSAVQLIIEILAIVMPPVGAAATGLQSLREGRRLSRSYQDHADALTGIGNDFLRLKEDIEEAFPSAQSLIDPTLTEQQNTLKVEFEFRLKRLVLRTEELLASELRQWWLIMVVTSERSAA
jgi:hypothetical protein